MKKIIMTMFVISMHLCCTHGLSASQSALPEDDATEIVGLIRRPILDEERNTRFHHLAAGEYSIEELAAIFENYSALTFTLCLETRNRQGKTALHIAVENRKHEFILAVIIGYAASLKRSEYDSKRLHRMYDEDSRIYMDPVIDNLSQPFLVSDNDGNTFMHLAAQRGDGFYGAVSSSLHAACRGYRWIKNSDEATTEDRAIALVINGVSRRLHEATNNAGQTPLDVLAQSSWPCLLL